MKRLIVFALVAGQHTQIVGGEGGPFCALGRRGTVADTASPACEPGIPTAAVWALGCAAARCAVQRSAATRGRWPSFVSCAWTAFYPISRRGPSNYAS